MESSVEKSDRGYYKILNMRVKEVEDVYEREDSDPILYKKIRELAVGLIIVNDMGRYRHEIENIAHRLAKDMYMRIKDGELHVEYSWKRYIEKTLRGHQKDYLQETRKQIFESRDPYEKSQLKQTALSSSLSLMQDYKKVEIKDFLERLPNLVKKFYDSLCKFSQDYPYYNDLYISLALSIIKKEVVAFGIPESLEPYLSLLYSMICYRIGRYIKRNTSKLNFARADKLFQYESFIDEG